MATKKPSKPTGLPGDYSYGILNSIEAPIVGKTMEAHGADVWSLMARAAASIYEKDAVSNTGPYRGVVLRVESPPFDLATFGNDSRPFDDPNDATHYIYDDDSTGGDVPELVRIKVRIPEIHAHLPVPSNWGDVGTLDDPHQRIIDLYPTYVGQSDMAPQPAVGDIVWVDYTNKNNFTDPIYIRPVLEKQHIIEMIEKIARKVFEDCSETSDTSAALVLSDRTPNVEQSTNQNYPRGIRTIPAGAETIVIEAGQSNGVFEPESEIKPRLIRMAKAARIKIKAWTGRLEANGGRNVVVMMPLSTDLANSFEIIYHFAGAGGWFSQNTPAHILKNMKTLADAKRNFVFVYIQCPWHTPKDGRGSYYTKVGGAGGNEKKAFLGPPIGNTKGGNFEQIHNKVLSVIEQALKGSGTEALKLGFITCTCHSRGGIALATIAATGGFNNVQPDKITLGDADYQEFLGNFNDRKEFSENIPEELLSKALHPDWIGFSGANKVKKDALYSTRLIYDYYIKEVAKEVEYNILFIAADRGPVGESGGKIRDNKAGDRTVWPRLGAERFLKTEFPDDHGWQIEGQNNAKVQLAGGSRRSALITYMPLKKRHGPIGIEDVIVFVGNESKLITGSKDGKEVESGADLPNGDSENSSTTSSADMEEAEFDVDNDGVTDDEDEE